MLIGRVPEHPANGGEPKNQMKKKEETLFTSLLFKNIIFGILVCFLESWLRANYTINCYPH
jgi:hypothetical protein